jgi:hypothetical protein
MSILGAFNWITLILAGLLLIPIVVGIVSPFSSHRMQRSLSSLLSSLVFLASLLLTVYLTGLILKNPDSRFLTNVCRVLPAVRTILASPDIWTWVILVVVLTALLGGVLYLLTLPIYRFVIVPATDKISAAMNRQNGVLRRFLGALWELPRAAALVLTFALLLNLYSGINGNARIEKEIEESGAYRFIDAEVLEPILSSSLVRKIPVLLNDTFENAAATLQERNIRLIRYFNGMTLDDAVKSNTEIDAKARAIVGEETDDAAMAKLLYGWISKNITYDDQKAAAVAAELSGVSSGAAVAFGTGTGICFDYACLYVAMCRAVDMKVRFVTGLGYSGSEWGDHAWNQVYDPAGDVWLNVDTTFGSSGKNYFGRAGFDRDHQDAVVQGEW